MKISTTPSKRITKVLAIAFWLLVWQLAAMAIGHDILLVSPIVVLQKLAVLIVQPEFWRSIFFSFTRILAGFGLAIVVGTVFAAMSAVMPWFRTLLQPLTSVIKATPVVSFIILALIWLDSRSLSMFISFLMVMPIIYTNTLQGFLNVDKQLLELAQVFRISPMKKLLYIYLPDIMPFFVSACSVSIGLCWKSGITAEVIGTPVGSIGENLYNAKLYLETGELFAWTVVIIILSVLFEKVFLSLIHKIQKKIEGKYAA